MTDRDRDDDYSETTMDEPRDFSTWFDATDGSPAPTPADLRPRHESGPTPFPATPGPAPAAPPLTEPPPAPGPVPRACEPTMPLPANEAALHVAQPPNYLGTEPLPTDGGGRFRRLDLGPTEIDAPINVGSMTPTAVRVGGNHKSPPPTPDSDTGLKLLLLGLVLLIVAVVIAIVVGIAGSVTSSGDDTAESAHAQ